MMYLSQLLIDTGGNPDHPRPGRNWLSNVYNVHRRLSMAFPLHQYRLADPNNLSPYKPMNFDQRPFLYRIDHNIDGTDSRAVIIVQSHHAPDWEWCFQNAPDFLAAPVQVKSWDPTYAVGDNLYFKIKINAAKKSSDHRKPCENLPEKSQGKRLALTWDAGTNPDQAIGDWLSKKIHGKGFEVSSSQLIHLGWVYGYRPRYTPNGNNTGVMRFRSALLEGKLRVSDPNAFRVTLETGLGSAKSFGFGLISVFKA
jgi:CRISPR system Cascade subunit CasE